MPQLEKISALHLLGNPTAHAEPFRHPNPSEVRVPVDSAVREAQSDPLLTAEDIDRRLNVSKDWVWDHSSRKSPHLPVIRMGDERPGKVRLGRLEI
jgi:hypothetical protein